MRFRGGGIAHRFSQNVSAEHPDWAVELEEEVDEMEYDLDIGEADEREEYVEYLTLEEDDDAEVLAEVLDNSDEDDVERYEEIWDDNDREDDEEETGGSGEVNPVIMLGYDDL